MTANDHGHLNNLDRTQTESLKGYWIALTNAICNQSSSPVNMIMDSVYGEELVFLISTDNPDSVLLRWLRARKWNIDAAVQLLMETLKWQHNWGVRALVAKGERDLSDEEIKTGKSCFIGYDKAGRPINYVPAKNHIKGQFSRETSEKLTVFLMIIGQKLLQAPVESGTIVFDLAGFGMKNMDYQHVAFFSNLVQNHYPEALAQVLILNAPWVFYGCWAIIKQWLDPVVQSKIHFIKNEADLAKYIDPSILPRPQNDRHSDFEYIPPTAEDEAMQTAFHADVQGKARAQAAHKEAAQHYISVTLRWAHNEECPNLLAERETTAVQLTDAFEKLIPYISTRTHYHRSGVINEPIFQVTYDRLRTQTANNS